MTFYGDVVVPWLCHLSMRARRLMPYRNRAVGAARGRVLEIGVGSGLNLPLYGGSVHEVLGLEPSPRLVAMAARRARSSPTPVKLVEASAESIPIESSSIDTLVTTWTMCTIPKIHDALTEMRRVLRPGGQLIFVEHGLAPDTGVRRWQERLNPTWKRLSGGCHLDRPIINLIEAGGFAIDRLETGYMPGPKPLAFIYEGQAHPR